MIEELDENTLRDSFKDKQRRIERLEEHDMLKSTLSLQSLPLSLHQLSQFPGGESSEKLAGLKSKLTPETMSKASSIESLLQSSGNEIFDVIHKNRQRRMLDLIRIIDTKMMTHPSCHYNNNNDHFRRKKRDRTCRNFNPRNLRQNLHNQFLRKRLHNHKRVKTSFSKDSPLNESMSTLRTLDTSSYNSSLESIATHDAPIQSHLCRTTESFHFITKRSTVDPFKSNSDTIEMMQLKTNDTNHSISSTPVDHAVHESHSIFSISKMLDENELTNITNTANMTYNSCVSPPSSDHRQQDEASLSPSYPLPAVSPVVSKVCQLPATKTQPTASLHRRSSDSDLSVTPKGERLPSS